MPFMGGQEKVRPWPQGGKGQKKKKRRWAGAGRKPLHGEIVPHASQSGRKGVKGGKEKGSEGPLREKNYMKKKRRAEKIKRRGEKKTPKPDQ